MYRTIDTATWTDPKVRQLDSTGRLAFLYLITNPHTHVGGIYYLPAAIACLETGLTHEVWDRVCDRLSQLGLCRFDSKTDVVWVVNMLSYQGKGEKVDRSVAAQLDSLHNTTLINDFLRFYPSVKRYRIHRVSRVRTKQDRIGIQEQEQEQDKKSPPTPPRGEGSEIPPSLDTPDFRRAWADWQQYRTENRKTLKPTTAARQLKMLAGWGVAAAVASLEQSIRNGWTGLFEPRPNGHPGGAAQGHLDFGGLQAFVAKGEGDGDQG